MKQIFIALIIVLPIITIQTSCKKSKNANVPPQQKPPIALDSMVQCHGLASWDSAAIHDALINTWEWEFIKCYWNPEDANGEDYTGLSIEFKPNDSLEVKVNNQVTQVSSWNLSRMNEGYFKLSTSPLVYHLTGKILFCSNRVLFYDTYIDGCDNYFKKQN